MKSSLFSKIIFASLALVLAGSAFAANAAHKENFQLSAPTLVNGTELPAGDYQARWDGSGPSVQGRITQGKKMISTLPAQGVEVVQAPSGHETETKNNSNHSPKIS